MTKYLPDNPHALGTIQCVKYEHERHRNTAFGSWKDRSKSYDRLTTAFMAYKSFARKSLDSNSTES